MLRIIYTITSRILRSSCFIKKRYEIGIVMLSSIYHCYHSNFGIIKYILLLHIPIYYKVKFFENICRRGVKKEERKKGNILQITSRFSAILQHYIFFIYLKKLENYFISICYNKKRVDL